MKIVIDIPDEMYRRIALAPRCARGLDAYRDRDAFVKAIQNGIPFDEIRVDVINIADGRQSMPVRSVIKIIDKYKAESEGKNDKRR